MRFLVYLTTLLLFSVAAAQSPTILQGDYISNVFGNSNFVRNPNAQTTNCTTTGTVTCQNVTVSNAEITRSTTTPLVAKSEFRMITTTSTGYADWALRTFDQGMKGQNCEARFSYRGFSVGSTTAQIRQGANVVAQLTLTPSTDPRIASINFPCGDLSSATTFRLQQATASLTGTNEIGGIYIGLATNMANVAQAELVVSANRSTAQSIPNITATTVVFSTENNDVYGEYDPTTGIFTAKRAGEYFVQSMILYANAAWTVGNSIDLNVLRDSSVICSQNYRIQYTGTTYHGNQVSCHLTMSVGQQIKLQTYHDRGSASDLLGTGSAFYNRLQIYRFPSSSELVVTPERQNVFGGVKYYGSAASATIGAGTPQTNTYATFNSAGFVANRTLHGKCETPTTSANDIGCSIPAMPVGSYKVELQGLMYNVAVSGASNCSFELYESTTATSIHNGTISYLSTGGGVIYETSSLAGIFKNNAVGVRNFIVRGAKTYDTSTGNAGNCQIFYNNSGTDLASVTFTITPLDQPSNSALYVQGPVKAAETGAAIPAGYVGEMIRGVNGTGINLGNGWNVLGSFTLPVGVWNCSGGVNIARGGSTINAPNLVGTFSDLNGAPSDFQFYEYNATRLVTGTNNLFDAITIGLRPSVIRSTGTQVIHPYGTATGSTVWIAAYVGTVAAGTPVGRFDYQCVRLN